MRREVLAALLLLALLVLAFQLAPARPGPGPLALCVSVACVHAALLAPSIARRPSLSWGLAPVLLALPALGASTYGHPGAWPPAGSLLLVAAASLAGAFGRGSRLYLGAMLLVFALPFGLSYLVLEFGDPARATAWRLASPVAAAGRVASGAAPPAICLLLLLAWPVWVLARRQP